MGYFGSKATSGLCQPIIAMMPPHDTYIETHLGGGALMRRKPAALRNIGIDRDARALDGFECDYPVELTHGCAHRFLSEYAFEGSELIYSDPPYLRRTRTSKHRYRFDYEEADHVELLELLKAVRCQVMVSGYRSALYEERLAGWRRVELQVMMHVDETSLRVDRKNHWIHVYSAGTLTVKCLHPKRGCEAIEAIGILPRYGGVAVHDCWASYLSYAHCDHALCGAHLLRELAFIVDAHGYAWAKRMKRLLLGACHQVSKRDDKMLSAGEYKALQKRYRTILTQGASELPPIPPRQNGQRGKVAKSDAHNLWERLKNYETAVLRFAKHPDVAFTNNRAERDLRMSKVKQKVSGCFRTRKYAEAYCRISSYLQSMANQGYNPLVAIQIALAGRAVDNVGE